MKLWTNGSIHVQLAPVARPRIPATLRVFEGGTPREACQPEETAST